MGQLPFLEGVFIQNNEFEGDFHTFADYFDDIMILDASSNMLGGHPDLRPMVTAGKLATKARYAQYNIQELDYGIDDDDDGYFDNVFLMILTMTMTISMMMTMTIFLMTTMNLMMMIFLTMMTSTTMTTFLMMMILLMTITIWMVLLMTMTILMMDIDDDDDN